MPVPAPLDSLDNPGAADNNQSMHVPLMPQVLQRLREEASRRGVGPEECASQIIEERLSNSRGNGPRQSALDILDQWDLEDKTDDPAEISRRQRDFDEFKEAINASHSSHRKIYP